MSHWFSMLWKLFFGFSSRLEFLRYELNLYFICNFKILIRIILLDLWLAVLLLSIFFDTLFLNPLKVFMTRFLCMIDVRSEVLKIADIFEKRAKFIFRRKTGSMESFSDLIHHFNPVCRAARTIPELSISRLLISLNDYDFTQIYEPSGHSFVQVMLSPVLFIVRVVFNPLTALFPQYVYDALLDFISVIIVNFCFFKLCGVASVWAGIGLFVIISAVTFRVGRNRKIDEDEFLRHNKKVDNTKVPIDYDDFKRKKLAHMDLKLDDSSSKTSTVKKKTFEDERKRKSRRVRENRSEAVSFIKNTPLVMAEAKFPSPRTESSNKDSNNVVSIAQKLNFLSLSPKTSDEYHLPMIDEVFGYSSPRKTIPRITTPRTGSGWTFTPDLSQHNPNSTPDLSQLNPDFTPLTGPGWTFKGRPRKEVYPEEYPDQRPEDDLFEDDVGIIVSDIIEEDEALHWLDRNFTMGGPLSKALSMQGPGFSKMNRILLKRIITAKSRTRKVMRFPLFEELTPDGKKEEMDDEGKEEEKKEEKEVETMPIYLPLPTRPPSRALSASVARSLLPTASAL